MTAVTADRDARGSGVSVEQTFAIKTSVTLYIGTLVNLNTSARLVDGVAAASQSFAGVVVGFPDGSATGNTAGTVRARVEHGRLCLMNVSTAIRTNSKLGLGVHVLDNVTVSGATTAGTAAKRIL